MSDYFKETNKYYPKLGVYIKHCEYPNLHIGISDAIFDIKTDKQLSTNFNKILSIYEKTGICIARLSDAKINKYKSKKTGACTIEDKYAIYDMKTGNQLSPFFDYIKEFNEETQKYIARTGKDIYIYRLGTNEYNNVKIFDSNGYYRTTLTVETELLKAFERANTIIQNHTDLAIPINIK